MSEKHVETISFSIEGDYITNVARDAFYKNHHLKNALEIISKATICPDMSTADHLKLTLDILEGNAEIIGNTRDDTYGVKYHNENGNYDKILNAIEQAFIELSEYKEMCEEMQYKLAFIEQNISSYDLKKLEIGFHDCNDEYLFDSSSRKLREEQELDEYTEQRINGRDDDYGWLEPNGTFHPVPWGNHSDWAQEWLNEHYPFAEHAAMYWKTDADGKRHHYVCGDCLVYCLHWVLIDSPMQGKPMPHYDEAFGLTKAQKEFLYDYFIQRNRHDEANKLYQE